MLSLRFNLSTLSTAANGMRWTAQIDWLPGRTDLFQYGLWGGSSDWWITGWAGWAAFTGCSSLLLLYPLLHYRTATLGVGNNDIHRPLREMNVRITLLSGCKNKMRQVNCKGPVDTKLQSGPHNKCSPPSTNYANNLIDILVLDKLQTVIFPTSQSH